VLPHRQIRADKKAVVSGLVYCQNDLLLATQAAKKWGGRWPVGAAHAHPFNNKAHAFISMGSGVCLAERA